MQPIDFCHIRLSETWLSSCPISVWPSVTLLSRRWNVNHWSRHSKHCTIYFLTYLLPDKAALLSSLPSDHTRGFPASCPTPGVNHPASTCEFHPFFKAEPNCYLPSETFLDHYSDIFLLSSPLGGPRTCLLNWTLASKNLIYISHLRFITCFGYLYLPW